MTIEYDGILMDYLLVAGLLIAPAPIIGAWSPEIAVKCLILGVAVFVAGVVAWGYLNISDWWERNR